MAKQRTGVHLYVQLYTCTCSCTPVRAVVHLYVQLWAIKSKQSHCFDDEYLSVSGATRFRLEEAHIPPVAKTHHN